MATPTPNKSDLPQPLTKPAIGLDKGNTNTLPVDTQETEVVDVETSPEESSVRIESRQDSEVSNVLRDTGQIRTADLNRSLYTNQFLNKVVDAAGRVDREALMQRGQSFEDVDYLTESEKSFFGSRSQNVADQTNIAIKSLTDQFTGELLPSIQSAAQDRAIMSGMITGELGLTPEMSTRNLSFVGDAQSRAQQQVVAAYNDFSNQVQSGILKSQEVQTDIMGQAIQQSNQNKAFNLEVDKWKTDAFGNLYEDGQDTGQQTLMGRAADQEYNMGELQLEGQELLNEQNRLAIQQQRNQIAKLEAISGEVDNYSAVFEGVANGNPESIAQLQKMRDQYGDAFGLYWMKDYEQVTDSEGNVTGYQEKAIVPNPEVLSEQGLLLNANFENFEYERLSKDMKDGEKPHQIIGRELIKALKAEEGASNILNKIVTTSDDNNKALIALNNTDPNSGATGYNFFSVDLSGLNDSERAKVQSQLFSIKNDAQVLTSFTKKLEELSKGNQNIKFEKIPPDSAIERMNSADFARSGQNRMMNTDEFALPTGRELMAYVVSSTVLGSQNPFISKPETSKDGASFDKFVSSFEISNNNPVLREYLKGNGTFSNRDDVVSYMRGGDVKFGDQKVSGGGTVGFDETKKIINDISNYYGRAVQKFGSENIARNNVLSFLKGSLSRTGMMSSQLMRESKDYSQLERLLDLAVTNYSTVNKVN